MQRRFPLLLAAVYAFELVSCGSNNAGLTPPVTAPARGTILSFALAHTITIAQMSAGLAGKTISALGGPPRCNVALYAIKFETVGVRNEPADASAAFFVPEAPCRRSTVLVSYAEGTNVVRSQTITHPTKQDLEPTVVAAIYASHGYPLIVADYLGLGYSSYPYQPYVIADVEASTIIDSIRAANSAAKHLHVAISSLFLTGHSQGGQSAMATQRAIEAQSPPEFKLFADAPSSGPYDLTQTTIDGWTHPGQNAPILATYILTSYQRAYGNAYANEAAVFQQPYANGITNLLPVATYADASKLLGTTIPLQLNRLLQPSFAAQFVSDPHLGVRQDIAANDLVKGWKPVAPLYLCGGSRDPQVEFKNSQTAYRFFKGEGANVTLTDVNPIMPPVVPISLYHDAVLVLCLTLNRVHYLDPVSVFW